MTLIYTGHNGDVHHLIVPQNACVSGKITRNVIKVDVIMYKSFKQSVPGDWFKILA